MKKLFKCIFGTIGTLILIIGAVYGVMYTFGVVPLCAFLGGTIVGMYIENVYNTASFRICRMFNWKYKIECGSTYRPAFSDFQYTIEDVNKQHNELLVAIRDRDGQIVSRITWNAKPFQSAINQGRILRTKK